MRSSFERSNNSAYLMMDVVANIVHKVTVISKKDLKSKACNHKVTKARAIFVTLCAGVVNPVSMLADYLSKNNSMVTYYKQMHNEYYPLYGDFREMSDNADKMLTEILTTINGNFEDVFQEKGQ